MRFEQEENNFFENYILKDFDFAVSSNSRICPEQNCKYEFEETSLSPMLGTSDFAVSGTLNVDKGNTKRILGIYSSFRPPEEREENGQTIQTVEGTLGIGKEPVNEAEFQYNINGTLVTHGKDRILSLQGVQCTGVNLTDLTIISDCNY